MRVVSAWAAVAVLGLAGVTGCNRPASSGDQTASGSVAVIDLDAVAQRLGSDKQMADSISQRQNSLNQQLVEMAKSYSQQITEKKKTLEETQPEQSGVTLAAWEQQANANLNKVKQQAAIDLQKHRSELIQRFRDEIKPAARRVAQSRGLSVIVTKNDSVLFDCAPTADITDAVVQELLAAGTPKPLPAP